MSAAQRAPSPGPGRAPSATRRRRLLLALAVLGPVALHLSCLLEYGPFRDELYYMACGEHLAWGYVDHPPFVAAVAWLARSVAGDSLLAVRLPSVLAGALTGLVTASLARRLGASPFAAAFAALAMSWAPLYLFVFHHLNMNAFEVLLFTVLTRLLIDAVEHDLLSAWLGVGATLGVGLLNKYGIGFYAGAVGVGLLATPARRVLARRGPWLAAGVALVLFAPHVVWQVTAGLPSLEFMRNAQAFKIRPTPPADFLIAQVLLAHPANAALWLAGLVTLLGSDRWRAHRWLGVAYVALAAFFLAQHAKPYYLCPVYASFIAIGVTAWEAWLARAPTLRAVLAAAHAVAGAALAPTGVPILPVETFVAYQAGLGLAPPRMERSTLGVLPQHYADMFGWREVVDEVARVHATLPAAERGGAGVVTRSYGEAAAIDVLGRERGLPRASSGHNAYFSWGPQFEEGAVLLVVGPADLRSELEVSFDHVAVAGRTRCEYCLPSTSQLVVYVCRGWKQPRAALWARLRRFI